MIGIINCYKPQGLTSFDVIRRLRKILSVKKMGHSGTLDPLAEGVLPVFIGKATRIIEYQKDLSKIYRAEMKLGARTDTMDREGKIIEEKPVPPLEKSKLISLFSDFTGNIEQIPPMYSSLKHKGEKLYNLARKGLEVERKARPVKIYKISLIDFSYDLISFEVECSPGTYIRTLCDDMGTRLGSCACLNNLIRLKSGSFHISSSYKLEEIDFLYKKGEGGTFLLPFSAALNHFPSVTILPEYEESLLQGKKIYEDQIIKKSATLLSDDKVCIYNGKGELMALSQVCVSEDIYLKPLKVFAGS